MQNYLNKVATQTGNPTTETAKSIEISLSGIIQLANEKLPIEENKLLHKQLKNWKESEKLMLALIFVESRLSYTVCDWITAMATT